MRYSRLHRHAADMIVKSNIQTAWKALEKCRNGVVGTEAIPGFVMEQQKLAVAFDFTDISTWLSRCTIEDCGRLWAISGYFTIGEGYAEAVQARAAELLRKPQLDVTSIDVCNLIIGSGCWGMPQTQDDRIIVLALRTMVAIRARKSADLKEGIRVAQAVSQAYDGFKPSEMVDDLVADILIDTECQATEVGTSDALWNCVGGFSLSSGDPCASPFDDVSSMLHRWPLALQKLQVVSLRSSEAVIQRSIGAFCSQSWTADSAGDQPTHVDVFQDETRAAVRLLLWVLSSCRDGALESLVQTATNLWAIAPQLDLHEAVFAAELGLAVLPFAARSGPICMSVVQRMIAACLQRGGDHVCRLAARQQDTIDIARFAKRWLIAYVNFCDCQNSRPGEDQGPLRRGADRAVALVARRPNFSEPLRLELLRMSGHVARRVVAMVPVADSKTGGNP